MYRIVRFLAVIALALSPVWGVPSVLAASMKYPTWPNFESDGCNTIPSNTGFGITISCGTGGFALTQINSGYACNNIDISVSGFSGSQFTVVATAQSGSVNNTFTIGSDGDYYLQFPYFLTNNLVTLQIGQGSGSGGVMTINSISTSSCPVATNTPTANPSNTSTNTPVPVTGTPTPIPTYTPLPSGHNTFTVTNTPLPYTSTPSATSTSGPSPTPSPAFPVINCGQYSLPLLDCNMAYSNRSTFALDGHAWQFSSTGSCTFSAYNLKPSAYDGTYCYLSGLYVQDSSDNDGQIGVGLGLHIRGSQDLYVHQLVTTHSAGEAHIVYSFAGSFPDFNCRQYLNGVDAGGCSGDFGVVGVGTQDIGWHFSGASNVDAYMLISNAYVGSTDATDTPTISPTPSNTSTPVPGTATMTSTPTITPVPIPGAPETPIPTDTECPGGCAVAKLTAIPGMSTRVTVDTSPFDPLKNMSITRSSCVPFGYLQIPVPHIIGTPAFGSTTPLSYTWTTPITGPWDNSIISGSIVLTNTAIEPCAMSEIPSFVWDLTYWLSVLMLAVGWFLWLIGFVGRLSGEETING